MEDARLDSLDSRARRMLQRARIDLGRGRGLCTRLRSSQLVLRHGERTTTRWKRPSEQTTCLCWLLSHGCNRIAPKLGLIARELAMDIAHTSFSPEVVEHLPSVANTLADALSRLEDPNKSVTLPQWLAAIHRAKCTQRDDNSYVTLPAGEMGFWGRV